MGAFDVQQRVDVVERPAGGGGVESVTAYSVSKGQGDEVPLTAAGPVLVSDQV